MRRCLSFLPVALVLSGWLPTGCRTAPAGKSAPRTKAAEKSGALSPAGDRTLIAQAEAHAHYAAGVIHDLKGETDAALGEFYQAALNDPDDETLIHEVSARFLQNQQPEMALELLQSAVNRPNASGDTYARLGFICSRLGRDKEALAANRLAVKKAPRALAGYRNLFLAFLQGSKPEEAMKILDAAGRQPGVDAEFLIGVAELYGNYSLQFPSQREAGQAKTAAMLARVKQFKLTDPQLRLKLADGFYQLGNTDEAAQLYLGLVDEFADRPLVRESLRAKLANLYLRGSDHQRQIEQLEAVVRNDPSNAQAWYLLGSIACDEKRWQAAAENWNKTLIFAPDFEEAYYNLAGVQIAAGDAADALVTLEKARRKFPSNFALEYWLGMAHNRQKNYLEAANHFTIAEVIAQATDPKRLTPGFYFQLGAAFERQGDRAQAESYFEKCLKLQPDFTEALNYLGYMLAERGEKLDRARELIEQALKAEPNNAAFLDSMGWVFFKQNQPKAALAYILKAVELTKEPDATLYDHLGDIYAALNEMDKAREAWRKSWSVEKNEAVQKKLEPPENK